MSDVLAKICADKRAEVQARKQAISESDIEAMAKHAPAPRGFTDAINAKIAAGDYALIAEIKRASPSKGLIRKDFDPATLAKAYMDGGATCLSVLTDVPYFMGKDAYLNEAKDATDLPVLRKDFMLEPYQIYESRAIGADCVLLIMAAVSDPEAQELVDAAQSLGMNTLVEVHDEAELERASALTARLLGINNRNLKTLEVDLATSERLLPRVPKDKIAVAESGLNAPADLARMSAAGANCFLVGESLMRQPDVAAATRALLARPDRQRAANE